MHFFEIYYNTIIKYDLINKFKYNNLQDIPKLKKIILTFSCKNSELKQLSNSLLALKLITKKQGTLTVSKKPNILLKIRKGNPVGCKVILTKKLMYQFLEKLLNELLTKSKNKILIKKYPNNDTFLYNIPNPLIFKELEKNYFLFNALKNLQVTLLTTAKTNTELFFLLNSLKILVKIKFANVTQLVECNLAKIKAEGSNPFFCSIYLKHWISGRVV